jgi:hypothetical protein
MPADTKTRHADEPNGQTPPGAASDPATALFSFWAQWMDQSARGSQAVLELVQKAGDPQQFQRQWLEAVSRSLDGFMRSPAFLEAMSQNLKGLTDMKALQNKLIGDAARQLGVPTSEDITVLAERLHGTEQTVVRRLKAIEERLLAIEAKLGPPKGP